MVYAGEYVENIEYLRAYVDSEDHFLWGIKEDGSIEWAKGIPTPIKDKLSEIENNINVSSGDLTESINQLQTQIDEINNELTTKLDPLSNKLKIVDNNEYLHAIVDSNEKILFGIKETGEVVIPNRDMYKITTNNEWIIVWIDNKNRPLFGIKSDGYFWCSRANFESLNLDKEVEEITEQLNRIDNIEKITDEISRYIEEGGISLSGLDGVSDHNTPNLIVAAELEKTFNDGTNSFTPPNEGYEMSNRIECQAGDWFTRTGTATGMVVVTDENDKNGTRLFNDDGTTLGNTFQIPTDLTWVHYIRMAVEVGGANDGSVVICKGKEAYVGENYGNFITIPTLKIEKRNLTKEVQYIKSEDGSKYYELYVDSTGAVKTREVDPDIIPESDYPTNWVPFTLTGSFDGYFDRMLLLNKNLVEIKANGVTNYQPLQNNTSGWGEFAYYNVSGGRYVAMNQSKVQVLNRNFEFIDIGNPPASDIHDVHYISDTHILTLGSKTKTITVPGDTTPRSIIGASVGEYKRQSNDSWKEVGRFNTVDYPELCTEAYGNLGAMEDITDNHQNTVTLDYDGNLIVNQRNWETWLKIKRTENEDGTVTLGSKTLDYDEAVIGRVGGRHNSAYINPKRVLNPDFSFTDTPTALNDISDDAWEEWQWFHCHDVKYWGMKNIGEKDYPTYTLYDNNYWTENKFVEKQYNILNKNNNILINPQGSGNYYLTNKDSNENYANYTHSRMIQLTIDWENHLMKDYRVYYVPKYYSREQGGCTMYDEGIISVAYSYEGDFVLWDFTTEETNVTGHTYKGAKRLFYGKYDNYRMCYRANTVKF